MSFFSSRELVIIYKIYFEKERWGASGTWGAGSNFLTTEKKSLPGVSRTPDLKITLEILLQSRALASLATGRQLNMEMVRGEYSV